MSGTVGREIAYGSASKQILVLCALEELTRLVTYRIGEVEGTRQPTHFAQPVGEIPFRFRPPATTGLLAAHSSGPTPLLPGEFIPLRVGAATDFRRQAAIMASCCEWRARAFSLVFVELSPLRPTVDLVFVDDEPTVLADGFDCIVVTCPPHSGHWFALESICMSSSNVVS